MISTKKTAVAVTLLAFVGVAPAFGHAHLSKSIPAAGATVNAPNEIVLAFTEPLEPAFSTIELHDRAGKMVKTGKVEVKDDVMRLPLKPLAAGQYTVNWQALSVDTHKTNGKFTFTVKP
jgi:methionine-rich copper-binding protein CopC